MVDFSPGALSRVVPRHRVTVEFRWCKRDWMPFDTFKAARTRMGLSVFDHCWWCKTPFASGDVMALAQPLKGANRVLCQTCSGSICTASAGAEQ